MPRTFLPLCTVDQRFAECKMEDLWFGGCWAKVKQGHGTKSTGIPWTRAHGTEHLLRLPVPGVLAVRLEKSRHRI